MSRWGWALEGDAMSTSSKWRRRYNLTPRTRFTVKRMFAWRFMIHFLTATWITCQIGPWYFELFQSGRWRYPYA